MAAGKANGEFLLAAATALAIRIAHERTVEEIELLAALFEVLGDQLALLALQMPTADQGEHADGPGC